MGDMGGLSLVPLFLRLAMVGLMSFESPFSLVIAAVGVERRLMITGNNVNPVKKTSLAIKTGSLNNEVKLSPCILSSSIPSAVFGSASRERIFPTDAVT
jgi:hypothetical protein